MGQRVAFEIAAWARQRCGDNIYAVTDICRLQWMHNLLTETYERVLWVDADVLIFAPDVLAIDTQSGHAFAHELFLCMDNSPNGFTPQEGINNAFMVFERKGLAVLEQYQAASLARVRDAEPGPIPRTALLPLNLDAMHASRFEALPGIGLFTLGLMQEIASGGGRLTRAYHKLTPAPLGAANLCHFLRNATAPEHRLHFDALYLSAINRLLAKGALP